MATANDRKPSVSNWFFSLRRQPKPKKCAVKKNLRKSCVDLTSIDKDCKSLPASVTNSPKPCKNMFFQRDTNTLFATKSQPSHANSSTAPTTTSTSTASASKKTNNADDAMSSTPLKSLRKTTFFTSSPKLLSKQSHSIDSSVLPSNGETMTTTTSTKSNGKTITTITKISKTTVITNKQLNGQRVGLTYEADSSSTPSPPTSLISNLDAYQNFAKIFRSKLIEPGNNIANGIGCVRSIDSSSSSPNKSSSVVQYVRSRSDETTTVDSDKSGSENDGLTGACDENRAFKSSSLDDDIEYIDSSSSLSDIVSSSSINSRIDDYYFNTIPKLPKTCATCKSINQQQKQQQPKSKSEWNISVKNNNKQIKDELCEVVAEMEALDTQEDCKHSNKDKQMSIGRKKFNMDPKKGIEYLCENHLLRMDAQDVAHFLYKGEGLNKTAIGDYLGEKNDFNEAVLKAFVELHDFTNLILVQALRQFLWSFRLPGEAQKIDRMMECFAQRYCQLNPDIFTNTDTCYVLSFAIIMLNTSLHNPSVKDKPSVEQFISMNRGINNGGDLPRELLESLYESIRTEPFKIPQDDGNDLMHTFFNPDKEGWLWKQGGRYKSWKRRWFILNDNCLYYFEYTTDKEPRGIIPLENIRVREIQDRSKPHCFELYACGGADIIKACKTDSEGKVVEGKHSVYRMSAATEDDKQEWIKCLTQSISHNPFYDILVQRKKKALTKS